MPTADTSAIKQLSDDLSGRVSTAQDADWDTVRQGFNLAADLRPAAVVHPVDVRDVIAVVAFAREHGLRVAPQTTGHNGVPLRAQQLDDTLLLRTSEMRGVEIDAEAQSARVLAGNVWADVVGAAAEHGLAALHGSSGTVGVTGYSLGGGTGWYARKHGLQSNSVTAVELVTPDGREVRADHDSEPELFWALRGGGGNFGIVTALEFKLYPITEAYAGMFLFDWERAGEVLKTWNEMLPGLPDELTSIGRILQVPDMPEIPEMVRGGKFAGVEAAFLGDEADGAKLLAPLRELGPDIDTFAMVPAPALAFLHMDPPEPVPGNGSGRLYEELPAEAIDELVAVAGAESGSPLVSVELRHTAGALARSGPDHGALATLDGSLLMYAVGMAMDEQSGKAVNAQIDKVLGALRRHEAGSTLNFAERSTEPEELFTDEALRRLRELRSELDGDGLMLPSQRV